MRAVAQLAAESFNPDDDNGSQHVVNHFNGHRILKRLIANDVERMKDTQQTGKSFMPFSFCIHCLHGLRNSLGYFSHVKHLTIDIDIVSLMTNCMICIW